MEEAGKFVKQCLLDLPEKLWKEKAEHWYTTRLQERWKDFNAIPENKINITGKRTNLLIPFG